MNSSEAGCRSHCPINYALETFGDRWTLLVIRDLMFKGKKYYGDFLASDEKISTNILADRLKRLEAMGVVTKEADPENRSRALYALTEKGRDLLPIMLAITQWSGRHDASSNAPRAFLDELEKDRDRVERMIREGWEEAED